MSIRTENDPLPLQHTQQQPVVKFEENAKRIVILEEYMKTQHRYNFNHDTGVRGLIEDIKMQHKQLLELRQILTEQSNRIKLLEEQRQSYFTIVPVDIPSTSSINMQNLSNLVNEPEIAVEPMADIAEVSPVIDAVETMAEVLDVAEVSPVIDAVEPMAEVLDVAEVSPVIYAVEPMAEVSPVIDAIEPMAEVLDVAEVSPVLDAVETMTEVLDVAEVSPVLDAVEPMAEVTPLIDVAEVSPVIDAIETMTEVSPVIEVPNVVEVYTGIDLPDFEVVRPKRMTKVLKKKITKC